MTTETKKWEVLPISDLPAPGKSSKAGAFAGLTEALRMLQPNETLRIAIPDGMKALDVANRVYVSSRTFRETRKYRTRATPDGVWAWWESK